MLITQIKKTITLSSKLLEMNTSFPRFLLFDNFDFNTWFETLQLIERTRLTEFFLSFQVLQFWLREF